MFTNKISTAVAEANTLDQINSVSAVIWKSHSANLITDDVAQRLAVALDAKKKALATRVAGNRVRRTSVHLKRPATCLRLRRRRTWSSSSQVPASIACHYTPGQLAVLSVIVSLLRNTPTISKTLQEIGDIAGVCRKTVQRTLNASKALGHLKVVERRASVTKNLPHVISAIDPVLREWINKKPVRWTNVSSLKKQIYSGPYKPASLMAVEKNIFNNDHILQKKVRQQAK